jgi:Uma2 family endonuclease
MLNVKPRFASFAEYLQYKDDSKKLYELFNGELIEMPPESGLNIQIANRLFLAFALMLGTDRVRGQGLELEVRGEPKNRYPDLTIIREEHIQQLSQRNTIRLSMLPPLLVIEIVSPGDIQRERDYIAKRIQYQDCRIPEYWIVDPQTQTILILELRGDTYTEIGNFSNNNLLQSPGFTQLNLRVSEVFGQDKKAE